MAMQAHKWMLEEAEYRRINEKCELEIKKLRLNIVNAERISKTYWWTFGIALAAFLISLVLLILKIKGL